MPDLADVIKWLKLAWDIRALFGGDHAKAKAAVAKLRKWELAERKARDERMGRG